MEASGQFGDGIIEELFYTVQNNAPICRTREGAFLCFCLSSFPYPSLFELALSTPGRYLLAPLATSGCVVTRTPGGVWAIESHASELAAAAIEVMPVDEGVRLETALRLATFDASAKPVDWRTGTMALPIRLIAEGAHAEIVSTEAKGTWQRGLERLHRTEGISEGDSAAVAGPAPSTLARWFEALATLNRWDAASPEFFRDAAQLVVEPIGLDASFILRHHAGSWDVLASHLPHPEWGVWLDVAVADCLFDHAETWFRSAETIGNRGTPATVVAPWFNAAGELAGAVVGLRYLHEKNARRGVRHLEANLVRLLADAITSGQARRQRESEAARRRTLLEHAFTPALAERIESDPHLLDGQDREVSLLFADLRDFSHLFHGTDAGGLGPVRAYELVADVMDALTEVVLEEGGIIIDYYGDGLAAMWNAPFDQPDHAERACRVGLAMTEALKPVSNNWREELKEPLEIGIGIHTGPARVGNIGSRWKQKYGARGTAVNLTSRVEQVTKRLGVPLIVTEATAERISPALRTQRLCKARLAGVIEEVNLYAVLPNERSAKNKESYAEALALFEAGRLDASLRRLTLGPLADEPGPAIFLADQVRTVRDKQRGRRTTDHTGSSASQAVIDFVSC